MSASATSIEPQGRLRRLLDFLSHDPQNTQLLGDAASAAFDEGDLDQATALLDRLSAITPLPPQQLGLWGLVELKARRFPSAAEAFNALHALYPDDASIRFNLAWARSGLHDHQGVCDLLDEATLAAIPPAAALKIQAMHHLGQLDEALALGQGLAEHRSDDQGLMSALALVASDGDDIALARRYAELASDHPDGASTLGLLLLNDDQVDGSLPHFDRALALRADNPRAILGKGLALLLKGQAGAAAEHLDLVAEIFGTHLGSWVSAGWAHFVKGDSAAARVRFETALRLDDTFAESHGALAVLDVAEGQLDSAKRRAAVALRLDPQCLAAALAKSLLLISGGHLRSAQKVRDTALNLPIGADGRTIAQAMAAYGLSPDKTPPS